MTAVDQYRMETVGFRFEQLYATASGILLSNGEAPIPQPGSPVIEIDFPGSPLRQRSYLYEGSRGLSHLSAQVSLVNGSQTHKLFTITGSAPHGINLEDFTPSRIAGYRGEEYDGDYALSRWEGPESVGIILGYLGRAGLGRGETTAERVSGNLKVEEGKKVEKLDPGQRRLLGLVAAGISVNIGVANMVLGGTDPRKALEMLGRHADTQARAA